MFQAAVKQAQNLGDTDARYCASLEELGLVELEKNKFPEAEQLFQKVMAIKEKILGSANEQTALTMVHLADLYQKENRFKEAQALYEAALKNLPKDTPVYCEKLQNMGACYAQDSKFDDAERYLKESLREAVKLYGPDSTQVATITVNLSNVNIDRGNYAQAEVLATNGLSGQKNTAPDNQIRNALLTCLAQINLRLAKYGRAEDYAKQALNNIESSSDPDSAGVAHALLILGRVYKQEQKYAEAEPPFHKAEEILEKSMPDHPLLASALREMGELYVDQARYTDAEPLYIRAKAIRVKVLGEDHIDVAQSLADLAYLYEQQGKWIDAETACNRALSIYKKSLGENHPDYIKALSTLGLLYQHEHKDIDAETTLKKALQLGEQSLPKDHPDINLSLNQLACFYKETNNWTKAEVLYKVLLAKDEKTGASVSNRASDLDNLAFVLISQGKTAEASALADSALVLKRSLPGGQAAYAQSSDNQASISTVTPIGDKWCLCIGISNFKDSSINLKYAAKDASDFYRFMISSGNFKPDHTKLLVDKTASRENIIAQLGDDWLGHSAKSNDLVVIYISTHGSQSVQEANGTNFLVAYDTNKDSLPATGIPMQWLNQIIQEQVHCQRILVIMDVCHSGSAGASTGGATSSVSSSATDGGGKNLTRQFTMNPLKIDGSGQILLCSSSADQVSWESKEYPNGVFTRRLIEAFALNGSATTLSQAYERLRNNVESEVLRDRGALQTPVLERFWKGGDVAPLMMTSLSSRTLRILLAYRPGYWRW